MYNNPALVNRPIGTCFLPLELLLISGHDRSIPNADQCRSIKIKIQD